MNVLDAMKPTIDASGPSPFPSGPSIRDDDDATSRRLPRFASGDARAEAALRDASERHDGEMFPAATMLDAEFKHSTGPALNECVRSSAPGGGEASADSENLGGGCHIIR